jgi:hypothetical protein
LTLNIPSRKQRITLIGQIHQMQRDPRHIWMAGAQMAQGCSVVGDAKGQAQELDHLAPGKSITSIASEASTQQNITNLSAVLIAHPT